MCCNKRYLNGVVSVIMDPLWKGIPLHLAEHICNQLPKVRLVHPDIKTEMCSQRWMLAKSYNYYLSVCEYHTYAAMRMMKCRMDSLHDTRDVNDIWASMTPEQRLEFYFGENGPGTEQARVELERQEIFREWKSETMD